MDKTYLPKNGSWENFVSWFGQDNILQLDTGTKNSTDLFQEHLEGESLLFKTNNKLYRELDVAKFIIKHPIHDKTLIEVSQFLPQQKIWRQRNIPPSEKRKKDESIEDTVIRGLKEELEFDKENFTLQFLKQETQEKTSQSYNGLLSIYRIHFFEITINNTLFKEKYTIEESDGKISIFEWK